MKIPVYLVDEEIYAKCPTIILSTVDKFARLPWDVNTNTIFGRVDRLAGLKNKKNQIRVICTKCGVEMVRTVVSRRHDVIDMFAPSGMEHSELELREY